MSESTKPPIQINHTVIRILILSEEDSRIGDFVRLAESSERDLFFQPGGFGLAEFYDAGLISLIFESVVSLFKMTVKGRRV
jgi:hypothetical protein